MNKKFSQGIMVWFLPLILMGGLFYPVLGYIVFLMMVFFLTLSYFKGRLWCSFLCPRGAFLDLVLSKVSLKRKIPLFFYKPKVRWAIFFIFMAGFLFQFLVSVKNLSTIGFVFVRMCLITTLFSIILGIPIHQRTWCMICPMGTLQAKIHSLKQEKEA
jgi:polyferredoxin